MSDFDDVVTAVGDRLDFNIAAYGKAWTGEDEDTRFLIRPALDRLESQAETIRAFQEHYGEDYPGSGFRGGPQQA